MSEGTAIGGVESGPDDAPLVALVHGSMDRMAGMAKLVRRLEERYRVLRYDRRGYATSLAAGGPFTMEQHALDLVALLDGRPAVVFGHSLGGDVALAAADRHPEVVRAVVVYEAPLSWLPWWPRDTNAGQALQASEDDAAEVFLRRMIGDAVWERLPERTRLDRRAEGPALAGELRDLRVGPPWHAERITAPVTVARGELCHPHHERGMAWLAEQFRTVVHVVPGARHGAHTSHPDAIAALVEGAVGGAGVG